MMPMEVLQKRPPPNRANVGLNQVHSAILARPSSVLPINTKGVQLT